MNGGDGNDTMNGGSGIDIFAFCSNFGNDIIKQAEHSKVILCFKEGLIDDWDSETLTFTYNNNSVKVIGVSNENIILKFGIEAENITSLASEAFEDFASSKIFDKKNNGILA